MSCAVCISTLEDPRVLPCGHVFCRVCIQQHIRQGEPDCPTCRCSLVVLKKVFLEDDEQIDSLKSTLQEKEVVINSLKTQIKKLETSLANRDEAISNLNNVIQVHEDELEDLHDDNEEKEKKILGLISDKTNLHKEIEKLKATNKETTSKLKRELGKRSKRIKTTACLTSELRIAKDGLRRRQQDLAAKDEENKMLMEEITKLLRQLNE